MTGYSLFGSNLRVMEGFVGLPVGHFSIDLEPDGLENLESETETVPGEPLLRSLSPIVESIEISDEEVAEISDVEVVKLELLTPEQEIECMKNQERYGHFHRVELRELAWKARLSRVSRDIENESPSAKRARKRTFKDAALGEGWDAPHVEES